MSAHQPVETIDQVIDRLTEILATARAEDSPIGYFPALYRKITIQVRQRIERGAFNDGQTTERLGVIFANRYFEAYDGFRADREPTAAWAYSFRVADQWWPIALQHVLLGMNAHINLDLGIATAQTAGSPEVLPQLKNDFDSINEILAGMVGEVKEELARIWMTLRLFNRYLGDVEDAVINFSVGEARAEAWAMAGKLTELDRRDWPSEISRRDRKVAKLAHVIRYPGLTGSAVNKMIRLGERGSVARKIDLLS